MSQTTKPPVFIVTITYEDGSKLRAIMSQEAARGLIEAREKFKDEFHHFDEENGLLRSISFANVRHIIGAEIHRELK